MIELFHLLVYFDITAQLSNIDKITPHEPGDFLVEYSSGEEFLIEGVTVFGDKEAKQMRGNLSTLLNLKGPEQNSEEARLVFCDTKMDNLFINVLESKSKKSYFSK